MILRLCGRRDEAQSLNLGDKQRYKHLLITQNQCANYSGHSALGTSKYYLP